MQMGSDLDALVEKFGWMWAICWRFDIETDIVDAILKCI